MEKKSIPFDMPWELTDNVHRIEGSFAKAKDGIVSESDEMCSRAARLRR